MLVLDGVAVNKIDWLDVSITCLCAAAAGWSIVSFGVYCYQEQWGWAALALINTALYVPLTALMLSRTFFE